MLAPEIKERTEVIVYLKDGTSLKGKLVKKDYKSITLQTLLGELTIQADKISKIDEAKPVMLAEEEVRAEVPVKEKVVRPKVAQKKIKTDVTNRREPSFAFLLSGLCVSGLGQLYNGQDTKGFVFMGAEGFCWVMLFLAARGKVEYEEMYGTQVPVTKLGPWKIWLAALSACRIYSGIEAYFTAKKINEQYFSSERGLLNFEGDNLTVGFPSVRLRFVSPLDNGNEPSLYHQEGIGFERRFPKFEMTLFSIKF